MLSFLSFKGLILIPIRVEISRKLGKLCIGEITLGRADGVGIVELDKGMNVVAVHRAQKTASGAVGLGVIVRIAARNKNNTALFGLFYYT